MRYADPAVFSTCINLKNLFTIYHYADHSLSEAQFHRQLSVCHLPFIRHEAKHSMSTSRRRLPSHLRRFQPMPATETRIPHRAVGCKEFDHTLCIWASWHTQWHRCCYGSAAAIILRVCVYETGFKSSFKSQSWSRKRLKCHVGYYYKRKPASRRAPTVA